MNAVENNLNDNRIKVLIVDDSATIRQLLAKLIEADSRLEVVGSAPDPYVARDKIKLLNPDVLTLDLEMPRMDGHQFLRNLMRLHPMPVIMISSLTSKGAAATTQALELGAVDFICKPSSVDPAFLEEFGNVVCQKIVDAGSSDLVKSRLKTEHAKLVSQQTNTQVSVRSRSILALGASTGGTIALERVLSGLPSNTPGTVIVQHIPDAFASALAVKLNKNARVKVKVASDGEEILQGHAYLAEGDRHLQVVQDGAFFRCRLIDGDPVSRHRPSVDLLFDSVAQHARGNALAVLLTGMGSDGAAGMLKVKQSGASTMVQDEESSIVWGMPGAAVSLGAADEICPLSDIPDEICKHFRLADAA